MSDTPTKDWEMIASRLRSQGWALNWFSFVDRDGRASWRAGASKSDRPNFTVQAPSLGAAMAGLETVCQQAEMAQPSDS